MVKRVSAAQAKAHLAELVASVAYKGERVIIERRGKPVAALVTVEDLERLADESGASHEAHWPLNMVGLFADIMTDEEIEIIVDRLGQAINDAIASVRL